MVQKKMTIEKLAEMTHAEFLTIRQTMVTKDVFKEGMEVLLAEIQGLRSDVSESRAATRIEIAERRLHIN